MDARRLEELKEALREIVADPELFIPDQEAFELLHQIVPWPATEVGIFNQRGELLLHYREFTEWPGEFGKIKSWYVPGGYMKPGGTFESWCQFHAKKDGVLSPIRFVETCGNIKWMPGEHPFSNLISIACVCTIEGELEVRSGAESKFMFSDAVVETQVPHHYELQQMFFRWRDANLHRFKR